VYHKIEEFEKLSEAVTIFVASADSNEIDKTLQVFICFLVILFISIIIIYLQIMTNPSDSVLIVMALYANVALKMPSADISVKVAAGTLAYTVIYQLIQAGTY